MNVRRRLRRLASISLAAAFVAAGLTAFAACGGDDDDDDGGAPQATATPAAATAKLEIVDAWVRSTTNDVSAAYFTVKNSGAADTLIKATTTISPMVQLHEVIVEGTTSKMQEKPGGFPVPANGELVLKPGGFHVMLMGLTAPLKEGETVQIDLQFEKAGTVKVSAPVKPGAGMSGMGQSTDGSMASPVAMSHSMSH